MCIPRLGHQIRGDGTGRVGWDQVVVLFDFVWNRLEQTSLKVTNTIHETYICIYYICAFINQNLGALTMVFEHGLWRVFFRVYCHRRYMKVVCGGLYWVGFVLMRKKNYFWWIHELLRTGTSFERWGKVRTAVWNERIQWKRLRFWCNEAFWTRDKKTHEVPAVMVSRVPLHSLAALHSSRATGFNAVADYNMRLLLGV